jgi:hypothetical protein
MPQSLTQSVARPTDCLHVSPLSQTRLPHSEAQVPQSDEHVVQFSVAAQVPSPHAAVHLQSAAQVEHFSPMSHLPLPQTSAAVPRE